MTDPNVPLTDEELSAALDGHADDAVIARLGADHHAQARYRQLESARDLMAGQPVVPLPAEAVDTLIARALAAADDTGSSDPSTTADGGVVAPIAFARSASRRSGPPMWAVAAVVVALVAVGVGLVWSGKDSGGSKSDEIAGAPTTPEVDASDTGPAEPNSAAPHGETPPPTIRPEPEVPASLIDLGDFPTKGELRSFLADAFPQKGTIADLDVMPSTAAVQRCADQMATVMGGEGIEPRPIRRAFVRIDGEPHMAFEFALLEPTDESVSLVTVVDPAACNPVFSFYRQP